MAFGFIVEKFSLFLWIDLAKGVSGPDSSLVASNLLGIVFIGLGGIMGLLAIARFMHVEKEIEDNSFHPSEVMDVLFALIFLVLSAFILLYVFNWHNALFLTFKK